MTSLRGVGYDAKTAVADLVDNAISADATRVWVQMRWDGHNSSVLIRDDGHGMSADVLDRAMTFGAQPTAGARKSKDLGRFGLGLKTASLSQARRLVVATKAQGGPAVVRAWNLDVVESADDWLVETEAASAEDKADVSLLEGTASGTVVIWRNLDRLVGNAGAADSVAMLAFQTMAREVELHLAMTFHRFLEGPSPRVTIFAHGEGDEFRVKPWDPYYRQHAATQLLPEGRRGGPGGSVVVRGVILPHKDRVPPAAFETVGGPDGWVAQQGFYVYRNERLLVAGTWLGLGSPRRWNKDEQHKLARIQLDIPNSLDAEWSLDIKKSRAQPPVVLREWLTRYATGVRDKAREVFVHRGSRATAAEASQFVALWHADAGGAPKYHINREHPVVVQCATSSGAGRKDVERLLTLLESTVPVHRIWLDISAKPEAPVSVTSSLSEETVLELARSLVKKIASAPGETRKSAIAAVRRTEPFDQFPSVLAALEE
jgi:hypothetical protein